MVFSYVLFFADAHNFGIILASEEIIDETLEYECVGRGVALVEESNVTIHNLIV